MKEKGLFECTNVLTIDFSLLCILILIGGFVKCEITDTTTIDKKKTIKPKIIVSLFSKISFRLHSDGYNTIHLVAGENKIK